MALPALLWRTNSFPPAPLSVWWSYLHHYEGQTVSHQPHYQYDGPTCITLKDKQFPTTPLLVWWSYLHHLEGQTVSHQPHYQYDGPTCITMKDKLKSQISNLSLKLFSYLDYHEGQAVSPQVPLLVWWSYLHHHEGQAVSHQPHYQYDGPTCITMKNRLFPTSPTISVMVLPTSPWRTDYFPPVPLSVWWSYLHHHEGQAVSHQPHYKNYGIRNLEEVGCYLVQVSIGMFGRSCFRRDLGYFREAGGIRRSHCYVHSFSLTCSLVNSEIDLEVPLNKRNLSRHSADSLFRSWAITPQFSSHFTLGLLGWGVKRAMGNYKYPHNRLRNDSSIEFSLN